MPFTIEHALPARASAERVWGVVCDLERYPEWNPFVVACRSSLEPGDPIDMRVRLLPGVTQPQREQVFEHQPGRRLSYGLRGLPLGALSSHRSHEVEDLEAGRSRYISRFELGGWLAPLVRLLLGRRLAGVFGAMSQALVARAESLAASDGTP